MELSSFITTHREVILAEWERDARRRMLNTRAVRIPELRDNLGELLETVAHDLEICQNAPGPEGEPARHEAERRVEAFAEQHGVRRAEQGLRVPQLAVEFPSLRRCVTRLWRQSQPAATEADLESLICFDESIDRALTTSVAEFAHRIDRARETLLGILGHDLRDPLTTIISGGALLVEGGVDEEKTHDVAKRIVSTGERMHHLVEDLLDAMRMRFGGRLAIERHEADLGEAVRAIAEEFATSHPDRAVDINQTGDLHGRWDDKRLSQAVANLLANAFQHAADHTPIRISISADQEICIAVHNAGPPIPAQKRALLFEPWSNVIHGDAAARDAGHLGLGLYIANAIVLGHGGHIEVDSSEARGTTFTIHLPATEDGGPSTDAPPASGGR